MVKNLRISPFVLHWDPFCQWSLMKNAAAARTYQKSLLIKNNSISIKIPHQIQGFAVHLQGHLDKLWTHISSFNKILCNWQPFKKPNFHETKIYIDTKFFLRLLWFSVGESLILFSLSNSNFQLLILLFLDKISTFWNLKSCLCSK